MIVAVATKPSFSLEDIDPILHKVSIFNFTISGGSTRRNRISR